MNKEDKRTLKQPYNEIDTECLDYIVNELKNNRSMQQMLNYYKGKYYSDRYWELKKKVDKAIEYIRSQYTITDDDLYLALYSSDGTLDKLENILRGEDNE